MGRQKSFIRIEGNVGGVNFYKNGDGYQAREKGGVSKKKIANHPRYARTRENMAEFARAATSARILRESLDDLVKSGKDRTASRRLSKLMLKLLKADTVNIRGERRVKGANTGMLEGFEFNENVRISSTLGNLYTGEINRVAGTLEVNIGSFIPKTKLMAPEGTTHFKVVVGGSEVDFDNNHYVVNLKESAMLPWNMDATAVINLVSSVTANSTHSLFLVLGIQFYQETSGGMYPLLDITSNPLSIIKVNSL